MKRAKQLKKYSCTRMGVVDFIFTHNNHIYAAKQLRAAPQNVVPAISDIGKFKEDVVYRDSQSNISIPKFEYIYTKQSISPNSVHYYTSRGWTEDEANTLLIQHRKNHISKESVKYDSKKRPWHPDFWRKYNLTGEAAIEMACEFQKKSLKYFKFRYGDVVGTEKYKQCISNRQAGFDRRRDSEIQNIMKMGALEYDEAVEAYRQRRIVVSPRRIEYWTSKGFSVKDAVNCVKQWQSEMSPRTVDYWIQHGYTPEQARIKVADFQSNNSVDAIMSRYNCDKITALDISQHFCNKATETKRIKNIIRTEQNQLEYMMYAHAVRVATNKTYRHYKVELDPDNLRGTHYQLDHKYPVSKGFENNVPVCIIACRHNLEIITTKQNREKGAAASIDKEKLIELYEQENHIKI